MALVLTPWFGRQCGRPRNIFGGPSCFTDLVVLKFPRRQATAGVCNAPTLVSSSHSVHWMDTPTEHIFKIGFPGLKKEDLHIQIEDDRFLYISVDQLKENVKEGDATSQSAATKKPECKFMRKFKLPQDADIEQIKAEVANEMLTVTVPKQKMKSPEIRKIEVSGGEPGTAEATASNPSNESRPIDESEQPSTSTASPSTANIAQ